MIAVAYTTHNTWIVFIGLFVWWAIIQLVTYAVRRYRRAKAQDTRHQR